jgi:TetR/AcrR family transcriptional regulator
MRSPLARWYTLRTGRALLPTANGGVFLCALGHEASLGMIKEEEAGVPVKRRKRDADATRKKILSVAVRHFVEKGYEGARVDEIKAESGFSKNLIYHYFQSKEGLFVAVLDELYDKFLSRRNESGFATLPPIEGLRKFVTETCRAMVETPEIISLLNSENLHKAAHVRRSKNVRTLYKSLSGQLTTLIAEGERQGVFRPGLDPIQLYISISSLMYHYLSNQHTFSVVLGTNLGRPAALKARRAHIVEMILRFCIRPEQFGSVPELTG